jgi:hypothetical protein
MPAKKQMSEEELAREVFLSLAPRWDVKDKASAHALGKASYVIAEAFLDVTRDHLAGKMKIKPMV